MVVARPSLLVSCLHALQRDETLRVHVYAFARDINLSIVLHSSGCLISRYTSMRALWRSPVDNVVSRLTRIWISTIRRSLLLIRPAETYGKMVHLEYVYCWSATPLAAMSGWEKRLEQPLFHALQSNMQASRPAWNEITGRIRISPKLEIAVVIHFVWMQNFLTLTLYQKVFSGLITRKFTKEN